MADDMKISQFIDSLPDKLKLAAANATKYVMDRKALEFGKELNAKMSVGTRQYSFVNVHTNTKLAKMERVTRDGIYGWHLLYNDAGYKKVSWKTPGDRGVPFNLIANVTSTGRHWMNRSGGKAHAGNYEGNHFIPAVTQSVLTGMNREIYEKYLELTADL